MRNETVFTDEDGVSKVVAYVELYREDTEIMAKEWQEGWEEELAREATQEEANQFRSTEAEGQREEALQVVEDAKHSDNPEIVDLANAFSTLLNQ